VSRYAITYTWTYVGNRTSDAPYVHAVRTDVRAQSYVPEHVRDLRVPEISESCSFNSRFG
jgi:hypothetical protein